MSRNSSANSNPATRLGKESRKAHSGSGLRGRGTVSDRGERRERARPLSPLVFLSWAVEAVPNLLRQGWSEAEVRETVLGLVMHPSGGGGLGEDAVEVAEIGVEAAVRAFRLEQIPEACRRADGDRRRTERARPARMGEGTTREDMEAALQRLRDLRRRSLERDSTA